MSDWTGIGGFVVGVIGVGVSGGSWIWAARANRTASKAVTAAGQAKDAVESLRQQFEREASEAGELLVSRVGPGVTIVNKSERLLRSVGVGPVDDSLNLNDLAEVGDIPALSAGTTNVSSKYPTWSEASAAYIYWLTEDHHRRFNVFAIGDADVAHLAAALKTPPEARD